MSELIYGKNTVIEYIKDDYPIEEIWLTKQIINKLPFINTYIKENEVKHHIMNRKDIDNIVRGNHQGIVAKIKEFIYYSIDDILEEAKKRNETPFIVILDGLNDPHNFGAILRTCDCCGVHGVVIPKNRSVGLNATVAKMSSGAIKHVKVSKVTNINNTIKKIKEIGLWVIGCDMNTEINYRKIDGTLPLAIVIGGEGKGISRLVKENCDLLVKIPMKGHISSLNASVAASVILYEVLNQRSPLD